MRATGLLQGVPGHNMIDILPVLEKYHRQNLQYIPLDTHGFFFSPLTNVSQGL